MSVSDSRRVPLVRAASTRACAVLALLLSGTALGEEAPSIASPDDARAHGLESLRTIVEREGVPLPDNLGQFVADVDAARQLGKALFHDMAAGSDGVQSCATCHYRAGADPRSKNQLSPDLLRVKNRRAGDVRGFGDAAADPDPTFEVARDGPNHTLVRDDFPFVTDIGDGANVREAGGSVSPAPGNSNDVAASQGIHFTRFDGAAPGALLDQGTPIGDPVFDVAGTSTRRVEPRNTPTTINAVFNFTNFWDGRANNRFNGENPFGKQDKGARILVAKGNRVVETPLNLKNASLASQAVGPPLSHFEMSFGDGVDNFRTFPELARKLLPRRVLSEQAVHAGDSLLGALRDTSGIGLDTTYEALVRRAFKRPFWDAARCVRTPAPSLRPMQGNQFGISNGVVTIVDCDGSPETFSLTESNFAFFWGVSVMLYEATLVADRSPFDEWMRGDGRFVEGFGRDELAGLDVFAGKGKCIDCHAGPELTNASVRSVESEGGVIEPMLMADRNAAVYDGGFYNIGVTPTVEDLGRGASDPFGAPLAFSRQFLLDALGMRGIPFPIEGVPIANLICDPDDPDLDGNALTCDEGVLGFMDEGFGSGFFPVCDDVDGDWRCGTGDTPLLRRAAVDGAFKTPGLRNVAETAPYFHNGGVASLMEVVEFYDRGGNFCRFNGTDLDPDIRGLGLSEREKTALVRFMLALSDPRVLARRAPFDGPAFDVPNGHPGDTTFVTDGGAGQATDDLLRIPAVGADGDLVTALPAFLEGTNDHFVANGVAGGVCSPGFPPVPRR